MASPKYPDMPRPNSRASRSVISRNSGYRDRGPHVVIDVVDLETGLERPLDLRAQLPLDLLEIRAVLVQRGGGLEEVSVRVHERRNSGAAQHRSPAIVLPLRVEGEVNASRHGRMPLEDLDRLLMPRRREHHRDRNGQATRDESLETHVHAVAHPRIVAADEEVNLVGINGTARRLGLADRRCRRAGRDNAPQTSRAKERSSRVRPLLRRGKPGLPTSHRVRRATPSGVWSENVSLYYGLVPRMSRRERWGLSGAGLRPRPLRRLDDGEAVPRAPIVR